MGMNSTPIQARSVIRGPTAPGNTDLLWMDTTTTPAELKQHDGSEWVPVASNPVSFTDQARTFDESDVTVSTNGAVMDAENEVIRGPELVGAGTSYTLDNNYTGLSGQNSGVIFTINQSLTGVTFTCSSDTELDGKTVTLATNNGSGEVSVSNALWKGTFTAGTTLTARIELAADERYGLYVSASDDMAYNSNSSYPHTGEYLQTVAAGWYGGEYDGNGEFAFHSLKGHAVDTTTVGTATVEWPMPADVYSWDAGTFTRHVPGGSSVNVYVEENDGSGWTEIAGPISRGGDLPAPAGSNIRYRVEISAAANDEFPTLNSVYRRYQV